MTDDMGSAEPLTDGGSAKPGHRARRLRRFIGAAILTATIVAWVIFRPDLTARAGAAMAAHVLCSASFVSGLDPATTDREFVTLHVGDRLSQLLDYRIDRARRSVTASFGGVFDATATYHEGYGCRVNHQGDRPLLQQTSGYTPSDQPAEGPVDATDPSIKAALDGVFRERPGQPRKDVKAVVVMVDGQVVGERYASGFGPETPVLGYSVTKSIVNALLGILVRQGRVQMGHPVEAPEWSASGDPRSAITYEQLLRMESGLDAPETGSGFDAATRMLFVQSNMAAFAASHDLGARPGSEWKYTSANTLILARAIGRIVGGGAEGMREFARRELFEPLGMDRVTMEFDGQGVFVGSSYSYAPTRAFARFGMLYARDGVTPGGRRLLPPGWVKWSLRSTLGSPYGAGFWTNDGPSAQARGRVALGFPSEGFFASGNFGQRIYIVPSRRLVVARFGYSAPPLFGLEDDIALIRAAISTRRHWAARRSLDA